MSTTTIKFGVTGVKHGQNFFIKYTTLICRPSTHLCRSLQWNMNGFTFRCYSSKIKRRPISYVHGISTTNATMKHMTIGQHVDNMAELYGNCREAFVDCSQRIRKTFEEYKKDIDNLAVGLLTLNFRPGDRVIIWSPNRYEWCVAQLAAAKLGIILTTLNPAYQSAELEYCINKVGAKGLIATETFKTQDYYKMITSIAPEVSKSSPGRIRSSKLPGLETVIMMSDHNFPGTYNFKDVWKAGGNEEKEKLEKLQAKLDADDAIMIQFTSGTTSKPKAVISTHRNLINGSVLQANRIGIIEQNKGYRHCVITPLFHTITCIGCVLNSIVHGNCIVLPAPSFHAGKTLQTIQEERCTTIIGTPTMFIEMMTHQDFNKTDFSFLENGVMGGDSCPPELIKDVMNKMHCPGLVIGYGATETSGAVFLHSHDDPIDQKLKSDGKIYDFMEAKLVNDQDTIVPVGEAGEICIRGYKVMKGYWGDEEKTKEVIKDGWYHTGDLGILNEDLTLKVIGRKNDMIIRGGENISPTEIEDFLISHQKIAEVHVIGVPDVRMGEEICAWIKLCDGELLTEEEIKAFCHKKVMIDSVKLRSHQTWMYIREASNG